MRHGSPPNRPLALIAGRGGRLVLTAIDRPAAAAGLAPGMSLADARTLCPELETAPTDPAGDAAALRALARWAERYTPWAAPDGVDGLLLDLTGCAHLFGGEAALLADLLRRCRAAGLAACGALAGSAGAAWALARCGETDTVLPAGQERDALAPLPVAGLRLDPATTGALERLGLRSIGDLYPLPRASLAARFGAAIGRRLDQALGRQDEPIAPQRPAAPYRTRLAFAEPVGRREDIAAALDRLLAELCALLERDGQGARRLTLAGFRVDHTMVEAAIGTARPARAPAALARLFAERLDRIDPGFGIETLVLTAEAVEPLAPTQVALPEGGRGQPSPATLADLIDRLGNRLGFHHVTRPLAVASHVPEQAFRQAPALALEADSGWDSLPALPPRPSRLLARPEALEVLAPGREAGWPPACFRWRRRVWHMGRARGPERILPEWWHGAGACDGNENRAAARDYWQVEESEGERFWLFRADPAGRWYLHGLFS